LKQALKYCANENQEKMIQKYIEHYQTGSIDTHKDSQRFWYGHGGAYSLEKGTWIHLSQSYCLDQRWQDKGRV
jgi:hypothetical protein